MWFVGCLLLLSCGCTTVFSKPVMAAAPAGLPWFAGFAPPPVETTPPFDLTLIQPVHHAGIGPDDMLEITIWDLYEPGKPHTFPSRVDSQGHIVVPHLDTVAVLNQSAAEVEAQLIESFRQQEILKQPRVLVRELSSAPVHAYVTGAVLRPGLINLPRRDASVFAALVAAGGLSRNAGTQVYVSDHGRTKSAPVAAAVAAQPVTPVLVAGNAALHLPDSTATHQAAGKAKSAPGASEQSSPLGSAEPQAAVKADQQDGSNGFSPQRSSPGRPAKTGPSASLPVAAEDHATPPLQQLVNHSGSLAVSADGQARSEQSLEVAAPVPEHIEEAVATRPDLAQAVSHVLPGHWYDLSVAQDREALKKLVLHEGDVVTVRPAAPPVRITGAVAQPGAYRAPANEPLSLTDAIQLAGGFGATDLPMVVVLTRPANSEHGLSRWSIRMGHGEKLPPNLPHVEPGDLVHVEPTAQARVQSLVGSLWPGK